MDQPLDLSQRDNVPKHYKQIVLEEELFCDVANCCCPRKHLTLLESPRRNSYESNYALTFNNHDYGTSNYGYPDFSDSNGYKRSLLPEMPNLSLCHPKRRKMEIFKQKLARSVSDNDLPSEKVIEQEFCSPYNDEFNHNSSQVYIGKKYINSQVSYDSSSSDDNSVSVFAQPGALMKNVQNIDQRVQETRVSKSSINHMERLPKKRAHARHLSILNESCSPNSIHQSESFINDTQVTCGQRSPVFIQPACPLINENSEKVEMHPWNSQQKPSVIKTPIEQVSKHPEPKTMSEKEKSFKALKADIIREIENDKDDEDINTFRKRFYEYCTTGAKAISSVMSDKIPGGIRMSALEYLISKTVEQRENKSFKPTNDHIHQIIKGEKPGKLCLMDMVELQVEIGLA